MKTSLRDLLNKQFVVAPGAFDGLSAKCVARAGFPAVYASGGAIARSTGRPDIGLLSLTEVSSRLREICEATTLPVIADADTGFGNELNTERTVFEFESAGAAAMHLEDQTFPKRCGHLDGKSLVPVDEMVIKLKAALKVRQSADFMIIARTDAIAVEGFDAALERAAAYHQAGADMLFVEAPTSVKEIETIAKVVPGPKLINMFYGGKTPLIPSQELAAMGYSVAIIPSDLQRAAISAMQKALTAIQEDGDSQRMADDLVSFQEREQLIETAKYLERSHR